jgi:type II secretory pathway pseudopilin PulG
MQSRRNSAIQGGGTFSDQRRAVSPVDVLLMLMVIALLIIILLPSLMQARQQAKAVKCLSNLKQMATCMHMYFNDQNDWFPWEKDNRRPAPRLTGVYYGGHPGRSITPPEHWWGYIDTAFRDTPAGRPFNQYVYPDIPKQDAPADDPAFEAVRNRPVYECPSDAGGGRDRALMPLASSPVKPLYREQGTSYVENYNFSLKWALANVPATDSEAHWQQFSNAFIKRQLTGEAAKLIMLYEDPFDFAARNQTARRGWHGKMNQHQFAFLDGHAGQVETLTEKELRGPTWKWCGAPDTGKGAEKPWWENPEDPDYRFRQIKPLPESTSPE